ncbi:AraC family transcriptional regulator [Nocardia sp. BMG111209]|uniref:AraC family transcriptional regulator n=1 Tax=Nocardia sp. BMG111209 TaxID=1160137 RepID=UPI0003629E99|nr:AraC family transcriptional regulator [Nocardia sp. BMG111209]
MTVPPGNLADRPAAHGVSSGIAERRDAGPESGATARPDDLLSELLRSVRLSGERVAAYRPPPAFSLGFAGTGSLHIIEAGDLELRIDGRPRVERVRAGDVVLVPRGDPHHLHDAGRGPAGPEPARWLCGTFTIGDPQAGHLLGALPGVIVLGAGRAPAPEGLEVARRMLLIEMDSPSQGSAVMISRILDLIFIQVLRAWAAGDDAEPNWLAGAFDPQIGLSLTAIHRDPGREWTVEELARVCNLSRSAFAARFTARVGTPPAGYLAQVRLDAATELLRGTSLPIALIAERVGYTSEAAFSRAFKNRYRTPPARWRRDIRGH